MFKRMRIAPPLAILAISVALAATTANASRVNGAYTTLATRDAAACAAACADDGLCMAWIRDANGVCELMAIAPVAPAPDGFQAGIAARAPAFAAWPKPVMTVAAAPTPPAAETAASAPIAYEPETEDTLALLGGPEG